MVLAQLYKVKMITSQLVQIYYRHGWRTHTILGEEDDNEFTKIIPHDRKLLDYPSIWTSWRYIIFLKQQ